MKVLLIEDEANIASFIAGGLEERGYEVQIASDGESGLANLTAASFDMVILDIVLPRMSGWEVCQHIRQKYAMNLPV
ncbi:MAG: DNA-binding response regulator, partial [Bacteroidetes bacterium]